MAKREAILCGNVLAAPDEKSAGSRTRVIILPFIRVLAKGSTKGQWTASNGSIEKRIFESIARYLTAGKPKPEPAEATTDGFAVSAPEDWDKRFDAEFFGDTTCVYSQTNSNALRESYSLPVSQVWRSVLFVAAQTGLISRMQSQDQLVTFITPAQDQWHYITEVAVGSGLTGGGVTVQVNNPRVHLGHRATQELLARRLLDRVSVQLYAGERWSWLAREGRMWQPIMPQIRQDGTDETEYGHYSDALLREEFLMLDSPEVTQAVSRVGEQVVRSSSRSDIPWQFGVLNERYANAFSLAGGYVYITTGLLDVVTSEDELAAVLAHEVAHVCNRDQVASVEKAEELNENRRILSFLASALTIGVSAYVQKYAKKDIANAQSSAFPNFANYQIASNLLAQGRTLARIAPQVGDAMAFSFVAQVWRGYGKQDELAADAAALQLMRQAGFSPEALISVLEKCLALENENRSSKSHPYSHLICASPGTRTRIAELKTRLNKAKVQ